MRLFRRWRLVTDDVESLFWTYAAAESALSGIQCQRWHIDEWLGRRWSRPVSFGWSGSNTSLMDLACMGVPIHQELLGRESHQ